MDEGGQEGDAVTKQPFIFSSFKYSCWLFSLDALFLLRLNFKLFLAVVVQTIVLVLHLVPVQVDLL